MTCHIPQKRRPHLKLKAGIWWCSDPVTCGMGPTKKDAYRDWHSRHNLIERMHSSQLQVIGLGVIRPPVLDQNNSPFRY